MKYSIALFGGVAATRHHLFHAYQRTERQLLHDPRKQTLDTRQHINVNRRLLRVLHRAKANPSLDENQRFQSNCIDGHLRPRSRFCRQRPCQLHRVPLAGFSSFMDYTANGGGNPKRLPDDLPAGARQNPGISLSEPEPLWSTPFVLLKRHMP